MPGWRIRHAFLNNGKQLSGFRLETEVTTHSFGELSSISGSISTCVILAK